jgi:hypothetical protein
MGRRYQMSRDLHRPVQEISWRSDLAHLVCVREGCARFVGRFRVFASASCRWGKVDATPRNRSPVPRIRSRTLVGTSVVARVVHGTRRRALPWAVVRRQVEDQTDPYRALGDPARKRIRQLDVKLDALGLLYAPFCSLGLDSLQCPQRPQGGNQFRQAD